MNLDPYLTTCGLMVGFLVVTSGAVYIGLRWLLRKLARRILELDT